MEPGELIREVRRRAGLTQTDLARRAGTSQPVISAYERGHRDPTHRTLRRMVEAGGARLVLDVTALEVSNANPPRDLAEHAARLVDALRLADAIPHRARPRRLTAPRMVSQ